MIHRWPPNHPGGGNGYPPRPKGPRLRAVAPLPVVVLRDRAMGRRDGVPGPGTDLFMAVTLLALLSLVVAVVIPAALGR
jgi:hypothetical protein